MKFIKLRSVVIIMWVINFCLILILSGHIFVAHTLSKSIIHNAARSDLLPEITMANELSEQRAYEEELFIQGILESENSTTRRTGWIPHWDFSAGVDSFKKDPKSFYSISPVLYEINVDGTLKTHSPGKLPELLTIARRHNVKIIPSVVEFDWQVISEIFNDENAMERHVRLLTAEVLRNNYDGIDIDYESTQLQDKFLYFEFLEKLGDNLKKEDKILSVSIISQWDTTHYSALPQTREVQDLDYLPQIADEIRIMSYDWTHQGSPEPGPIAPLNWMESVVEYAVIHKKVPRDKVWLGVHLYGYDWSTDPSRTRASARTADYIARNRIETEYDPLIGENVGSYQCGDFTCTIFHQSKEGVKARENLAKRYGIKGVAFWKIGREGELLE